MSSKSKRELQSNKPYQFLFHFVGYLDPLFVGVIHDWSELRWPRVGMTSDPRLATAAAIVVGQSELRTDDRANVSIVSR